MPLLAVVKNNLRSSRPGRLNPALLGLLSIVIGCCATSISIAQQNQATPSFVQQPTLRPASLANGKDVKRNAQAPITIPSQLAHWRTSLPTPSQAKTISETAGGQSIVIEIRRLSFVKGTETPLSKYFTPGTFEVITGSVPMTHPVATNETSVPSYMNKICDNQTPTKVAASIETTQVSKPVALAKISQTRVKELISSLKSSPVDIIQLPTVTTYSGQVANVSDAAYRPFVVGVKPKSEQDGLRIQPLIQTVDDGLTLRLKPTITDGKIALLADIADSTVTKIKTYSIPQFEDTNSGVSIQIPEVKTTTVHLSTTLKNEETLFVDAMMTKTENKLVKQKHMLAKEKTEDVETRTFLLITTRIVNQEIVQRNQLPQTALEN